MQYFVGRNIDATKSYATSVALAGFLLLIAMARLAAEEANQLFLKYPSKNSN